MGIVGGGAYAELSRIDHRMAMHVPESLSLTDAGAVAEVFVTAHEALFHLASLQPGESVLIHAAGSRSEEHTSELQSPCNLVCRLLLEKKKKTAKTTLTNAMKTQTYSAQSHDHTRRAL